MVRIEEITFLKLSIGVSVKAYVCSDTGHVLMIPLCLEMNRGRPKDPWRRGRDLMKQVARAVAVETRVPVDMLISKPTPGGQRAVHPCLIAPFVLAAYNACVDAEDLRVMTDICKRCEPPGRRWAELQAAGEGELATGAPGAEASALRACTDVIYVGGDNQFPVRIVPKGWPLEFCVNVNDFVRQILNVGGGSPPNWVNAMKRGNADLASLKSWDYPFPSPYSGMRISKVMNPCDLVKFVSKTGSKQCKRLAEHTAHLLTILEGRISGDSKSDLTAAILENHKTGQNNRPEAVVRDALALSEGGKTEVRTTDGNFVDIVTESEIIEVKNAKGAKHALGQILYYAMDWPQHSLRIHLFGTSAEIAALNMERLHTLYRRHNVRLTTQTIS